MGRPVYEAEMLITMLWYYVLLMVSLLFVHLYNDRAVYSLSSCSHHGVGPLIDPFW